MIKSVGFLGCGKIGRSMLEHLVEQGGISISFVQDIFFEPKPEDGFPVVKEQDASLIRQSELVVESANADVLKENFDGIIKYCDLMPFSVTAFSDAIFEAHAHEMLKKFGRKLLLPHGAILGIDGIFDGRSLLTDVCITTIKNPKSLGRTDTERMVLYDGSTREICKLYPRNVNVHATLALAGRGFDSTHSILISDPAVNTNTHKISIHGENIDFELNVSSFSTGGVTGKYTPYSACGSLDRVLQNQSSGFCFV